jgi:SHS2 domain-containing protein
MPYEELPHTADWSLRVWASDLESLFIEAAKGMNFLTGVELAKSPRIRRAFSASASDVETLLVKFLSELIFLAEHNLLAFDEFSISLCHYEKGPFNLQVKLQGAKIKSMSKAIKAVTFHNMKIMQINRGFEGVIVFDV